MTHPGVGPLTALAYVLIIGTPTRFQRGKQIGNYLGTIPTEDSSADKQRLGHISKQGNSLLRFLLVQAAQAAARVNPEWRRGDVAIRASHGRRRSSQPTNKTTHGSGSRSLSKKRFDRADIVSDGRLPGNQELACNSQLWLLFRSNVRPLHNNQAEQAALCHFVFSLYSRVVGPFRRLLG